MNVPKGIIEARVIKIKCFLNHGLSNVKTIINAIYAMNKNPCGIPSILTSVTSFPMYFSGTPTNSNSMYDKPSRKAMILKMVNVFMCCYICCKINEVIMNRGYWMLKLFYFT